MKSRRNAGRLVGALYILMALPSALSLTRFPARFIVHGDPATTAANIQSASILYRVWGLTDLIAGVFTIWMAVAIYSLFKDVNRNWARALAGILLVMAAMSFAITTIQLAPLAILNGASYWAAFNRAQLEALAYGFVGIRELAVGVISAYWGIWLVPVAVLVYRSGFLPRWLGILVGVAAGAYIMSALVFFVAPAAYRTVFWTAAPIYGVGETAFIMYMLIKGPRPETADLHAS